MVGFFEGLSDDIEAACDSSKSKLTGNVSHDIWERVNSQFWNRFKNLRKKRGFKERVLSVAGAVKDFLIRNPTLFAPKA